MASIELGPRLMLLEQQVAALRQRADDELVRLIAVTARGLAFTAADIIAAAPLSPALQELLTATRRVTARCLGKFLKRCEGRTVRGVRVRRLVKVDAGRLWVCDSVPDSQEDTGRGAGLRV
jgi:hypothetical protein